MDSSNYYFLISRLVVAVAVAASLCLADDAYICTRATYYGSPDCYGNPSMYLIISSIY